MLVSRRTPQPRRRSARPATAVGVVLLLASVACSSGPPPEQTSSEQTSSEPTTESTPLAGYDTADLALARAGFCERVADGAVAAALGGDSTDEDAWKPGSRLPESRDISNEFGCSWSSGSVSAMAWVFAPPITSQRAVDFAGEVVDTSCRRLRGAPALGEPSVAQHCGTTSGRTGVYGLVGDAWVGCEISGQPGPGTDVIDLVGEWCVAVLQAMRTA